MIKKSLVPFSAKWLVELSTPNMITFSAGVPSLWLYVLLVFLASFAAPNRQLCMRYMKNYFYTQSENNTTFGFLIEEWIYCANILQLRTSKPMLKSYIIKSKDRNTIFLIFFKDFLNFSNGYLLFILNFIVWYCYRNNLENLIQERVN